MYPTALVIAVELKKSLHERTLHFDSIRTPQLLPGTVDLEQCHNETVRAVEDAPCESSISAAARNTSTISNEIELVDLEDEPLNDIP